MEANERLLKDTNDIPCNYLQKIMASATYGRFLLVCTTAGIECEWYIEHNDESKLVSRSDC